VAAIIGGYFVFRKKDPVEPKPGLLKGNGKERRHRRRDSYDSRTDSYDKPKKSSSRRSSKDWFDRNVIDLTDCPPVAVVVKFGTGLFLACIVVQFVLAAYAQWDDPNHETSPGWDYGLNGFKAEQQRRRDAANKKPSSGSSWNPMDWFWKTPENGRTGTHNYPTGKDITPVPTGGWHEPDHGTDPLPVNKVDPPPAKQPDNTGSSGGVFDWIPGSDASSNGIGKRTGNSNGAIRTAMNSGNRQEIRGLPVGHSQCSGGQSWNEPAYEWCGKNTSTGVQECTKQENEFCWKRQAPPSGSNVYGGGSGTSGGSSGGSGNTQIPDTPTYPVVTTDPVGTSGGTLTLLDATRGSEYYVCKHAPNEAEQAAVLSASALLDHEGNTAVWGKHNVYKWKNAPDHMCKFGGLPVSDTKTKIPGSGWTTTGGSDTPPGAFDNLGHGKVCLPNPNDMPQVACKKAPTADAYSKLTAAMDKKCPSNADGYSTCSTHEYQELWNDHNFGIWKETPQW